MGKLKTIAGVVVTPLLRVGATDETPEEFHNFEEALAAIRRREEACVRTFGVAADVLRELGLSPKLVRDRIHFAKTGRVLVEG